MFNIFENISVKSLISRVNVCAPDWGEENCVYAYNKFYYFLEGQCTLILNGDTFIPKPEELFLIPAYTPHTYYQNPDHPIMKYWTHFNLIFHQEQQKLVYHKETVKCTIPKHQIIPVFAALAQTNLSTNPLDTLTEKSALLEILRIFLDNVNLDKILPINKDHFMSKMDHYIKQHLHSEISLNELADLVHLHPNYFIKYFKKHFSVTPIEYVNAIRLQTATHLLRNQSDRSIQRIAHDVGFNDYRYFSRIFKKKYGVSPSQY